MKLNILHEKISVNHSSKLPSISSKQTNESSKPTVRLIGFRIENIPVFKLGTVIQKTDCIGKLVNNYS